MNKPLISKTLLVAAVFTAAIVPSVSMAREGAPSVGHGIKCYTTAVQQPNGTVTYQQVCYKAI
jgi:hypothetical protein